MAMQLIEPVMVWGGAVYALKNDVSFTPASMGRIRRHASAPFSTPDTLMN
jgi:hypothetical protein